MTTITGQLDPVDITTNTRTNRIYVLDRGSRPRALNIISGFSHEVVTTIPFEGFSPIRVAVNPQTGRVYVYGYFPSEIKVVQDFVKGVDELLDELIAGVEALPPSVPGPQRKALVRKLEEAIKALDRGNVTVVINKLGDFTDQVEGLIGAGQISVAEGQPLIDAAESIIGQLGG